MGDLILFPAYATVPVYALGGMRPEHLDLAYQHGAQGIAVRGVCQEAASAKYMKLVKCGEFFNRPVSYSSAD
jgi:thiamine monophosphate synthase